MGSRSTVIFWIARRLPGLFRFLILLWIRTRISLFRHSPRPDHWLLTALTDFLDLRVPVKARLGNGMKVIVPWNDLIGRSIFESGYYEAETVKLIQKLLAPGMVFFDVGAHIGQYTLVASQAVGATGQVHSFEPDPDTYKWLQRNARLNRLNNVQLTPMALSNESGIRQLYLATSQSIGCNSLSPPSNYSGNTCHIECTTVDAYVEMKGIQRVDLIKVDVEGAEGSVLQGASSLLRSENKPIIIMEFEEARQKALGSSCAKLADVLTSNGYSLFTAQGQRARDYVPSASDPAGLNVLAIPRRKEEQVLNLLGA